MEQIEHIYAHREEKHAIRQATSSIGAFFTNEKVLKEVAELVKPCEKPLDPNAPEMVRGGEPDEKKGKCVSCEAYLYLPSNFAREIQAK